MRYASRWLSKWLVNGRKFYIKLYTSYLEPGLALPRKIVYKPAGNLYTSETIFLTMFGPLAHAAGTNYAGPHLKCQKFNSLPY